MCPLKAWQSFKYYAYPGVFLVGQLYLTITAIHGVAVRNSLFATFTTTYGKKCVIVTALYSEVGN
jgi:hypothetical protein